MHSSIISCVLAARENAWQVREQISSEMWSELNGLYHFVKRYEAEDLEQQLPLEFLTDVRRNISLFKGETDATMSHGEEWWFLQIGRHIERAVNIFTMLKVHAAKLLGEADIEHLELLALLRSCNALEAYLKRYTAEFSAELIVEFLLLSPQHPHSILFSVRRLADSLAALPQVSFRGRRSRVECLAGRFVATLSYSSVKELMSGGLHSALVNVIRQCAQLHAGIHQAFIDYPIEISLPNALLHPAPNRFPP
ncbi:MAG: alpha-E domain-containing protein [Acidobacteriota bacterium]